jgi:hypothetical protein
MARYTFEQIKIGDNIYYEDKYLSRRNLYWKVVAKLDKSILMIEPAESGDGNEKRMIDFLEARKFDLLRKD